MANPEHLKIQIKKLINLSLCEGDIRVLYALPPPERSAVASAKVKDLTEICTSFHAMWLKLVKRETEIDFCAIAASVSDKDKIVSDEDVWLRLNMILGSYYDFALRRLLDVNDKELPPGLRLVDFDFSNVRTDGLPFYRRAALEFTAVYFHSVFSSYFTRVLKSLPLPQGLIGIFEQTSHSSLHDMFDNRNTVPSKDYHTLSERLIHSSLAYLQKIYDEVPAWNKDHKPGPFSAIRLSELSLLGKRDEVILKRYGSKHVEKVFEQQLALIIQSFGMYVVSTKVYERTVDLVCISGYPSEPFTFLVEAKTSSGAYSLPTKDGRALVDYVNDVKRTLTSLPPLRFVLLVGNKASRTLADKLCKLEVSTGTPIRFCTSQQFATLRELLPGLLPHRVFVELLLTSTNVLSEDFPNLIAERFKMEQDAHKNFVEAMLSARGIIGTPVKIDTV